MYFYASRDRNTDCATDTTGNDRGYRIFCSACIDCGIALSIGNRVIIDVGLSGVFYITNAKGCANAGSAASANPTGDLDVFRKSISTDIKITATRYRAINIGFCCVYNHTDCRSPGYASR